MLGVVELSELESPLLNLSDFDTSNASAAPAPLAPANMLLNIGIYQDVYVRSSVATAWIFPASCTM